MVSRHEQPSVEDILASIKQVIARDNRDAAAARFAGANRQSAPEPADAEEAEDILELSPEAEVDTDDEEYDDGERPVDSAEDGLINEQVRTNMRESLAALSMLAEPGARPQIVRSGETSLEGLVREMLRPMLTEWLETNLPAMVEQMVQAEIARIAGKKP